MGLKDPNTKVCPKCGIEKYLIDFYYSPAKDRHEHMCKECYANRKWKVITRPEYDGHTTQTCNKCGQTKPLPEFHFNKRDGVYYKRCKSCHYILRRREDRKGHNLKARYDLTIEQFNELIKAQDYKCMVCSIGFDSSVSAFVDHDHASEMIRGILCRTCNTLLGIYKENIQRLRACGYEKHATYLEKFKCT